MDNDALIHLRKFVAPEFIFGAGARHLAGRYARNFGARKAWAGRLAADTRRQPFGHPPSGPQRPAGPLRNHQPPPAATAGSRSHL